MSVDAIEYGPGFEGERFWTSYVKARRPVVLKGLLSKEHDGFDALELNRVLTLEAENEQERYGRIFDANVRVEVRDDAKGFYGQGNTVGMRFKQFLHHIKNGSELYYLTTQPDELDSKGCPQIMCSPTREMFNAGLLPLRPRSVTGNLVPAAVNIWMGKSTTRPSRTPLHHDFHDNLYLLLRGKKTFRLYPPSQAQLMYTRGEIVKVHDNGRINYKGSETFPDGSDESMRSLLAMLQKRGSAEAELDKAQAAVDANPDDQGARDALDRAEQALDEALEDQLEDFVSDDEDSGEDERGKRVKTEEAPPSFCLVDPEEVDHQRFPKFSEASPLFCDIGAGEMLFLPCGWFHEVSSFGEHAAINFWLHPPDGTTYEKPYESSFWQEHLLQTEYGGN